MKVEEIFAASGYRAPDVREFVCGCFRTVCGSLSCLLAAGKNVCMVVYLM